MKILFVTTEFADFAKAGGLADVSAALPRALRKQGADVRVLLPGLQKVIDQLGTLTLVGSLPRRAGIGPCLLGEAKARDGLPLYVALDPSLYQRDGNAYASPDGQNWPDNDIRFARLALTAAQIADGKAGLTWQPDLVHANDWPTGLLPAFLAWENSPIPSIMTVHNLAHQGLFPGDRRGVLGVPDEAFGIDGVEFYGQVSFLKAGLHYANHITTVSPTYAREITTPEHGAGLAGLLALKAQGAGITGILNGLDDEWDPERDPYLAQPFDADDITGKSVMKERIRTSLCLAPAEGPLFGIVSRLVHQKGMDLVADAAAEIVQRGGQIAILGVGDPETEDRLREAVRHNRDHVAMLNGFNEPMAHRIMAASDFYLMPSRFEPCGLSQMHAQRYGALPVAHATGGLVDTVTDGETGFTFPDFSIESFVSAIDRAFAAYADPPTLGRMRVAAMRCCRAWEISAGEYLKLYSRLTGKPLLRLAGTGGTRAGAGLADLRAASCMDKP